MIIQSSTIIYMDKAAKTYFHERQHELPEADFPTINAPSLFYKVREQINEDYHQGRFGLRVLTFTRFQQDYIHALIQQASWECSFLNLFIIGPNLLYAQASMTISAQTYGYSQEEIVLESRLLYILHTFSQLFNKFATEFLREGYILGQTFKSQELIAKFHQKVIQAIKTVHKQVFE